MQHKLRESNRERDTSRDRERWKVRETQVERKIIEGNRDRRSEMGFPEWGKKFNPNEEEIS